jgi:ArsR family transcriptional regulator, arsenate/arsenite/antimonite-responsive transcriptional repressor / arsenate reductase (thioredoxin)
VGAGLVSRNYSAPPVLRLVGHPLRWRLLTELAHSDRQVRELTNLLHRPQSLMSYHLGRLRAAQLVTTRRSSADARDVYYSVNLAHCGQLLSNAGGALHPGLRLVPPPDREPDVKLVARRVLFLCTGNSARSQIAEALIDHLSNTGVEAFSAGSHPKKLHPNAVRVMRERGIEIDGKRVKHLNEFVAQRFNYVISLCDKVREVCPEFPGQPEMIHWSMPDPASGGGSDEDIYPAFQRTAVELETRIRFLLVQIQSDYQIQEGN